jgi:DNA polymerase
MTNSKSSIVSAIAVAAYRQLVNRRKKCRACTGLTNVSLLEEGAFDSEQIGPWSFWQGNLGASLMVVGQDWGDTNYCRDNAGRETSNNPTNETLRTLLSSIGIQIEPPSRSDNGRGILFFTNAILCLKTGGMQSKVEDEWFANCCQRFPKPTVDIVQPKVLVALGERASRAIASEYGLHLPPPPFKAVVETEAGFPLAGRTKLYPVYHCGRRILNTHRPFDKQLEDWARIGRAINGT